MKPPSPGARGKLCCAPLLPSAARAAAVTSALLLAAAPLMGQVTVGPVSGGPTNLTSNYYGSADGDTTAEAQFHTPIGMALDSTGDFLYVADCSNNAVRVLDLPGNQTFYYDE